MTRPLNSCYKLLCSSTPPKYLDVMQHNLLCNFEMNIAHNFEIHQKFHPYLGLPLFVADDICSCTFNATCTVHKHRRFSVIHFSCNIATENFAHCVIVKFMPFDALLKERFCIVDHFFFVVYH